MTMSSNTQIEAIAGNQKTMSSREIAELVEKRHDNVKRTIETLLERGVIASPQIEEKPTAGRPAKRGHNPPTLYFRPLLAMAQNGAIGKATGRSRVEARSWCTLDTIRRPSSSP